MELEITKSNYENCVENESQYVLLDFWAPWCGPCRLVAPVLEELATELEGKLVVGKVNVDEEMDLAQQFVVESIPTMVLIKNGQEIARTIGYKTKEQLISFISQYMG